MAVRHSHWAIVGAILALFAVVMGAFAAHGLKSRLPSEALAYIDTAVHYQFWHALALLWLSSLPTMRLRNLAGAAFSLGVLCFSGSLYYLAITGSKALVLVTPLGGCLLLLGWLGIIIDRIRER